MKEAQAVAEQARSIGLISVGLSPKTAPSPKKPARTEEEKKKLKERAF